MKRESMSAEVVRLRAEVARLEHLRGVLGDVLEERGLGSVQRLVDFALDQIDTAHQAAIDEERYRAIFRADPAALNRDEMRFAYYGNYALQNPAFPSAASLLFSEDEP